MNALSLEDLKKRIGKSKPEDNDLLSTFDDVVDEQKHKLKYNVACYQIVDAVFDAVIDVVAKDKSIAGFTRSTILSSVSKGKEPIKKYVLSMDSDDAKKVVEKIKNLVCGL